MRRRDDGRSRSISRRLWLWMSITETTMMTMNDQQARCSTTRSVNSRNESSRVDWENMKLVNINWLISLIFILLAPLACLLVGCCKSFACSFASLVSNAFYRSQNIVVLSETSPICFNFYLFFCFVFLSVHHYHRSQKVEALSGDIEDEKELKQCKEEEMKKKKKLWQHRNSL